MEEVRYSITCLPRGARIGPYTILRQVPGGVGGMAIVYEARLGDRGPSVALKVAPVGLGGFLKDETAFLKALNLNHPHIIKILPTPLGDGTSDYVVKDPETGSWYFAMEYMAGGSLADWLQRCKHLTLAQALDVVRQIGAALDAAHRAGIVHLDVKPSNILFRDRPEKGRRHAVLTDFGIARLRGRTASGQTTLTIEYASPEQARLVSGESIAVGPASDIYSLAVILYEMISGRLPFQAENDLAMMHQIVYEDPPLPVPLGPPQLNPIMQRALAKEPEERYPSAGALVADLEALPREVYEASSTRRRMHPLLNLGLGLLLGLGLGMPAGHYLARLQEEMPTPITIVVTATPTSTQEVVATDTPTITPTSATVTPTRRPTSTPVPATPTFTPRPLPTSTPVTTPSE